MVGLCLVEVVVGCKGSLVHPSSGSGKRSNKAMRLNAEYYKRDRQQRRTSQVEVGHLESAQFGQVTGKSLPHVRDGSGDEEKE